MKTARSLFAGALALAGLTGPTRASAQLLDNGGGFDFHLFRPAVDTKGIFAVDGTDVLGHLSWAVGLTLDYGRDQARMGTPSVMGGSPRALVSNNFAGTFNASLGLGNWVMLGVHAPVFHVLEGPGGLGVQGVGTGSADLHYQGIGDFALHGKVRFLRSELTHFGLALIVQATFGSWMNQSRSFAGDPGYVSLWPRLAMEVRPISRLRIDAEIGYRHFFGAGSTLGGVTYSPPLTFGLGIAGRVVQQLELAAEVYGAQYTQSFGNLAALPIEALGGLKVFVHRNSYLMLAAGGRLPIAEAPAGATFRGVFGIVYEPSIGDSDGDGYRDDMDRCPFEPEDFDLYEDGDGCPELDNDQDGIPDARDACPNAPEDRDGDADNDGCPESDDTDRDGDGVFDRVDQCPDIPEDRDRFQDTDGCPDPDNDQDGILDVDDRCRNEPEDRDQFEDADGCPDPDNDRDRIPDTQDFLRGPEGQMLRDCRNEREVYNGFQDEDGCPDEGRVVIEENTIRLLDEIRFETGSARIQPQSLAIVDQIARTLQGNPQFTLLEVQGHADERGNDDENLRLTQDRAASVVAALIERGVERRRLRSAGYGERCRAGYPPRPNAVDTVNAVCQVARTAPRWCHSERAWSRDRRVVLVILETDEGPTHVRIVCPEAESLIPAEDRAYHNPDG